MTLSEQELERYSRQLVLPEWSGAAQERLKASSVMVVGVGALGSPVAQYLTAAGVVGQADRGGDARLGRALRVAAVLRPVKELDLTGVPCPMNWVRTRLALEELPPGDTLVVTLDEGEPLESVPRSAREEGHEVTVEGSLVTIAKAAP